MSAVQSKENQNQVQNYNINTVPNEIILLFMQAMTPRDAINFGLSCKKFYTIQQNENLWKYFVSRYIAKTHFSNPENLKWKDYYREYQFLKDAFPCHPETFILSADWHPKYTVGRLRRQYSFTANLNDAAMQRIGFHGHLDGTFSLHLFFNKNILEFEEFFKSVETHKKINKITTFNVWIEDKKEIIKMIKIFKAYVLIPKEELAQIEKIVQAGNWKEVTPMSKEEEDQVRTQEMYFNNQQTTPNESESWFFSGIKWIFLKFSPWLNLFYSRN